MQHHIKVVITLASTSSQITHGEKRSNSTRQKGPLRNIIIHRPLKKLRFRFLFSYIKVGKWVVFI